MASPFGWYNVFCSLGYDAVIDPDGDVIFTDGGARFRCLPEPGDPTYLHIVLPGVWTDTTHDPDLRARASAIVHTVNGTVKVAKLVLGSSGVYASVEALSSSHAVAARQIPELLTMAKVAGQMFSEAFYKDQAADVNGDADSDDPPEPWRG